MSLPLWGQLNKSQDDAETIEQAIERIVRAHNEEPEAHLGAGQSLETHKKQDVLDHPAGSVVADKFSDTEHITYFTQTSIGDAVDNDNMIYQGLGIYEAYLESGVIDNASFYASVDAAALGYREDKNMVFSLTVGQRDLDNGFDFEIYHGDAVIYSSGNKVYFYVWGSGGIATTELVGVNKNSTNIYRWYYRSFDSTYFVFVNGFQVLEKKLPRGQNSSVTAELAFSASLAGGSDGSVFFSNGFLSIEQ